MLVKIIGILRLKKMSYLENSKKYTNREHAFWNMLSSLFFAVQSAVLLMFVSRNFSVYFTGIFSITYAVAQLLQTISIWGMREYQATDVTYEFSDREYLDARILTSIITLCAAIFYALAKKYQNEEMMILICIIVTKICDTMDNGISSMLQRKNLLALGGKLSVLRLIISTSVFGLIVCLTEKLVVSCIVWMVVNCILLIIEYNLVESILDKKAFYNKKWTILKKCFPLFISSFLSLYICSLPKYAIDFLLTTEIQAYFSVLFIPVNVINLLSTFIFRPIMLQISLEWEKGNISYLNNQTKRQMIIVLILTLVCCFAGIMLGSPILYFIYKLDISDYMSEFVLLLIGGGFNAAIMFCNMILTIIRDTKSIFKIYCFGAIIGTVLIPAFVIKFYMIGAAILYAFTLFVMFSLLMLRVVYKVNEKRLK